MKNLDHEDFVTQEERQHTKFSKEFESWLDDIQDDWREPHEPNLSATE